VGAGREIQRKRERRGGGEKDGENRGRKVGTGVVRLELLLTSPCIKIAWVLEVFKRS
jgi:hypothetical protein